MRLYKNQNENEHLRWFREIVIQFLNSFEYFITNQIKIKFYIKSLEDNSNVQWYKKFEIYDLDEIIFDSFKRFLLNLITNSINRRLIVYEKWKTTRQRDMKVSIFKTHFEKFKDYLLSFEKKHKANFFLVKLKSKLKNKILNINNYLSWERKF